MHVHCHTCGSMEIPTLLSLSSVSVASLVFFLFKVYCALRLPRGLLSLSSLALLLSMLLTISTSLYFIDHCLYTQCLYIPWAPYFAVRCLCTRDAHTYHCLLPMWGSLRLPINTVPLLNPVKILMVQSIENFKITKSTRVSSD